MMQKEKKKSLAPRMLTLGGRAPLTYQMCQVMVSSTKMQGAKRLLLYDAPVVSTHLCVHFCTGHYYLLVVSPATLYFVRVNLA